MMALILVLLVYSGKKAAPVDWSKNIELESKKPYGLYVFENEFEKMNPTFYVTKRTDYYREILDEYSFYNTTYFFLQNTVEVSDRVLEKLLVKVNLGNSLFISADALSDNLLDTLNLKLNYSFGLSSPKYTIWNAQAEQFDGNFQFKRENESLYFDSIAIPHKVLGEFILKGKHYPSFISIPYGQGKIFIHLMPYAFVNYYMLKGNYHNYIARVLSHLPPKKISWNSQVEEEKGDLHVINNIPSLRYAWYLFIGGFILLMVFNFKRRQRAIPIVLPLQNKTLEFVKTISNLFYQERSYAAIVDKKIAVVLHKIRTTYHLDTQLLDHNFIAKLTLKSGKIEEDIRQLVTTIELFQSKRLKADEASLLDLNEKINKLF